jgi:hypothetical protein
VPPHLDGPLSKILSLRYLQRRGFVLAHLTDQHHRELHSASLYCRKKACTPQSAVLSEITNAPRTSCSYHGHCSHAPSHTLPSASTDSHESASTLQQMNHLPPPSTGAARLTALSLRPAPQRIAPRPPPTSTPPKRPNRQSNRQRPTGTRLEHKVGDSKHPTTSRCQQETRSCRHAIVQLYSPLLTELGI